jgi:hypothetical protein
MGREFCIRVYKKAALKRLFAGIVVQQCRTARTTRIPFIGMANARAHMNNPYNIFFFIAPSFADESRRISAWTCAGAYGHARLAT